MKKETGYVCNDCKQKVMKDRRENRWYYSCACCVRQKKPTEDTQWIGWIKQIEPEKEEKK